MNANTRGGRFTNKDLYTAPSPARYPANGSNSAVAAASAPAKAEKKSGIVEITDLDLRKCSFGDKPPLVKDDNVFAFLKLDGKDAKIIVRGMPVTVEAYTDKFNNTRMDFKLPEGKEGEKLYDFEKYLADPTDYPNLALPIEGIDKPVREWFHPLRSFYGEDVHFVGAKVKLGAVFKREGTSITDRAIHKGEKVDVVFSVMLSLKNEVGWNDEEVAWTGKWNFRVEEVKAYERKTEGAEAYETIL